MCNILALHCSQLANMRTCWHLKVEKLARTLFLWKIEVHEQKEKVYEMRRWNEALVTNMLPEHVARHFLGSKKRDEVRGSLIAHHILNSLWLSGVCPHWWSTLFQELYSQSYDEIGVMFASIPNFSDFYTEESINNGGIECLRFLNEIISDFDSVRTFFPQCHQVWFLQQIRSVLSLLLGDFNLRLFHDT